jgi:protein-arginine kinase activator protein McsA
VSVNPCGHTVLADVTAVVEHLAHCPETDAKVAEWCRAIVEHVASAVALGETQRKAAERSRKTIVRSCERCGTTFETANVRKRFCTSQCRSGGHRERSGGAA